MWSWYSHNQEVLDFEFNSTSLFRHPFQDSSPFQLQEHCVAKKANPCHHTFSAC